MKKVMSLLLLLTHCYVMPSYVTYKFSGGRFGDNLRAFSRALWISRKTNVPLLYRDFEYSDLLALSRNYMPLTEHHLNRTQQKTVKRDKDVAAMKSEGNYLYTVPWKCKKMSVEWDDPNFIDLLRKEIAPRKPIARLPLPKDRICVALHIRTGSGRDRVQQYENEPSTSRKTFADKKHPDKFPPLSFFAEQLKRFSHMVDDQPIYAHIFTDSDDPQKLVRMIQRQVNKRNIMYGNLNTDDRDTQGVLEDFFMMTQFEHFIIPRGSSFSMMASRLAHWKTMIYPLSEAWEGDKLVIKEVATRRS